MVTNHLTAQNSLPIDSFAWTEERTKTTDGPVKEQEKINAS